MGAFVPTLLQHGAELTEPIDSYWELMAEMARLQGQLGDDLVAWAKMYEAGGRAMQHSSKTLLEVAELGRRMEHQLESGPPAALTQILSMLTSPWPGVGMPAGPTFAAGPFAQLWETWASGTGPQDEHKPRKGTQNP